MAPDFSNNLPDYESFRRPFPNRIFTEMVQRKIGLPGQRIADIGSGTGLVGHGLAGVPLDLIELDVNENLVRAAQSRRQTALPQSPISANIKSVVARAESCPLPDTFFDGIIVAQSWHWFDRVLAPTEMLRILKPGRPIAVAYYMHVPGAHDIAGQTEKLILQFQPNWRHHNSAGINGQVLRDFQANGFKEIESLSFDIEELFSAQQWMGYVRTLGVCNEMPPANLEKLMAKLAALLSNTSETFPILHRAFLAFGKKS